MRAASSLLWPSALVLFRAASETSCGFLVSSVQTRKASPRQCRLYAAIGAPTEIEEYVQRKLGASMVAARGCLDNADGRDMEIRSIRQKYSKLLEKEERDDMGEEKKAHVSPEIAEYLQSKFGSASSETPVEAFTGTDTDVKFLLESYQARSELIQIQTVAALAEIAEYLQSKFGSASSETPAEAITGTNTGVEFLLESYQARSELIQKQTVAALAEIAEYLQSKFGSASSETPAEAITGTNTGVEFLLESYQARSELIQKQTVAALAEIAEYLQSKFGSASSETEAITDTDTGVEFLLESYQARSELIQKQTAVALAEIAEYLQSKFGSASSEIPVEANTGTDTGVEFLLESYQARSELIQKQTAVALAEIAEYLQSKFGSASSETPVEANTGTDTGVEFLRESHQSELIQKPTAAVLLEIEPVVSSKMNALEESYGAQKDSEIQKIQSQGGRTREHDHNHSSSSEMLRHCQETEREKAAARARAWEESKQRAEEKVKTRLREAYSPFGTYTQPRDELATEETDSAGDGSKRKVGKENERAITQVVSRIDAASLEEPPSEARESRGSKFDVSERFKALIEARIKAEEDTQKKKETVEKLILAHSRAMREAHREGKPMTAESQLDEKRYDWKRSKPQGDYSTPESQIIPPVPRRNVVAWQSPPNTQGADSVFSPVPNLDESSMQGPIAVKSVRFVPPSGESSLKSQEELPGITGKSWPELVQSARTRVAAIPPMERPFFVQKPDDMHFMEIGEAASLMLSVEAELNWRPDDAVQRPPVGSVGRVESRAGGPLDSWLGKTWDGIRRNYGRRRMTVDGGRPPRLPPPSPPRRPNADFIRRRMAEAEFQPPFRDRTGGNLG